MANKKQPVKKRAYKKRSNIAKPITELTISNPNLVSFTPVTATNKDIEVECLTAMCSVMDNFTQDQRNRTLQFLVGKYYDFS